MVKPFRLSPFAFCPAFSRGFTLVEFLMSMSITSVLVLAIYSVYQVQTHSVKAQENRLDAQEYARAVLDIMVREIRNTGFFPVGACAAPANTAGIVSAGAQTIRFVYDGNAANGCADSNEDVTYSFSVTGCPAGFGNIMRQVGGNPPEAVTDCNVPTGTANFSFVYYPRQMTPTAPPPYCYMTAGDIPGCSGLLASNLGNVQRITVGVTVRSKSTDTSFNVSPLATVTSSVDLRNRGL